MPTPANEVSAVKMEYVRLTLDCPSKRLSHEERLAAAREAWGQTQIVNPPSNGAANGKVAGATTRRR